MLYGYNNRMNLGISFGIFDLSGVIMLVLAGTSSLYLLKKKPRSQSSQKLLWFFLCVILSAIATIVTNSGVPWDWAISPFQDALIILGGVFLVRFAYLFPSNDQPREARWVVAFFAILASACLTYSFIFAVQYISNLSADLDSNQAYYLMTPLAIVLTVFVFFRRSIHISSQDHALTVTERKPLSSSFSLLFRTDNRSAIALRNYGLALATALAPVVVVLLKSAMLDVIASFIFNFGSVIAISAIMLVYLNYSPEPITISAKLLGLSLSSILLILGFAGVWVYTLAGPQGNIIVLIFIALVLLSSVLLIIIFPVFYRTALLDPLNELLKGVKKANEGNLKVQVDVQYDDEIGFLTQSFNRMISSLNEATIQLKDRSRYLESEISQRTRELTETNLKLEAENREREKAEAKLNRQLRYQQSISSCSQTLLQVANDSAEQRQILNQALEHLRTAARASRAYVHQIYQNSEPGLFIRILAEASEAGISRDIDNPNNQKVPLTILPEELINTLAGGSPSGGLTVDVFANRPQLLERLLNRVDPLLSIQLFPIILKDQWWGYVGFDDCMTPRNWDDSEVSMLCTASEMIGNTLQRWEAEAQLRGSQDRLESLVEERTAALVDEIANRELLANDLENRLHIEREVAVISARLQDITDPRTSLLASLEDLGHIMLAERAFLVEYRPENTLRIREFYEWHAPGIPSVTNDTLELNAEALILLEDRLRMGSALFIEDTAKMDPSALQTSQILQALGMHSLLLTPLMNEDRLRGILGCGNLSVSAKDSQSNLHAFELVAVLMNNLLQREQLIQTLEERVAERTRQLTTFLDMAMLSDQTLDIEEILQPTLAAVIELSSCDACSIHLINEDSTRLQLVAQRGIPLEYHNPLQEIVISAHFKEWLEETNNFHKQSLELKNFYPETFYFPGYQTFYTTRIKASGKSQGLLNCYRVDDQHFTSFQSTILTALGELLGIIVENYRLRNEAEELATIEERQRLAREIHDAISQSVYSLSLFARSAKDAHDVGDDRKLTSNLQDLETIALQAMREMRLLLYHLRETGMEENISSALESRFNQVERRLGLHATFETNTSITLPREMNHEIWRIIIESLNNVIKHANAADVLVKLVVKDEKLLVIVQDDGIGYDTQLATHGMGLKNMRLRADRLGGKLMMISLPGKGTQMSLEVPLIGKDIE